VMGHLFATLNDDEQCLLRAVAEGEAYEDLAPRFRATVSALKTRVSRLRGQLRERRDATL
jgi:DNA-directed RNA polymerase specialized sigma24 family protein